MVFQAARTWFPLIHVLSALPAVLLGIGSLVYVAGIPIAGPDRYKVWFALELGVLAGWLLTVALSATYVRNVSGQFSLRSVLAFVAIAALGVAGIVCASVISFVAILLLTVAAFGLHGANVIERGPTKLPLLPRLRSHLRSWSSSVSNRTQSSRW